MKFKYVTDEEFTKPEINLFEHLLGLLKNSDAGQAVVVPRDKGGHPKGVLTMSMLESWTGEYRGSGEPTTCNPFICQSIRFIDEDDESETVCVTAEYQEWS